MLPNDSTKRYVAYLRLSKPKRDKRGVLIADPLGIDAQRADVARFVSAIKGEVLKEFVEIESGKRHDNRPELKAAMAHAKRSGATLLVAKLDRLSRNLAFLAALMETGVDFVCCDNPHANPMQLQMMAVFAQWERETISSRTKAGLAQAKARGTLLGSKRVGHWDGREDRRQAGQQRATQEAARIAHDKARRELSDLIPIAIAMRNQTPQPSLARIAEALNTDGHKTRAGFAWTPVAVRRLLMLGKER